MFAATVWAAPSDVPTTRGRLRRRRRGPVSGSSTLAANTERDGGIMARVDTSIVSTTRSTGRNRATTTWSASADRRRALTMASTIASAETDRDRPCNICASRAWRSLLRRPSCCSSAWRATRAAPRTAVARRTAISRRSRGDRHAATVAATRTAPNASQTRNRSRARSEASRCSSKRGDASRAANPLAGSAAWRFSAAVSLTTSRIEARQPDVDAAISTSRWSGGAASGAPDSFFEHPPEERRIVDEYAPPDAPGVAPHAERPFQADARHPCRRWRDAAAQDVDGLADTEHHGVWQLVRVAGHPRL